MEEDEFEFEPEEDRPVGRLERVEGRDRLYEIERSRRESKELEADIKQARKRTEADLAGMRETAVAALYSLMIHEDPGVRMKAVSLWFGKVVPNVAAERMGDDVIDVGENAGFDEIAKMIDKLKKSGGQSESE